MREFRTDYQIAKTHVHFHTVCRHLYTHTIIREKRAGKNSRCYQIGATLNILFIRFRFHCVQRTFLSMCCDIRESEMAMTTEKSEIENEAECGEQ